MRYLGSNSSSSERNLGCTGAADNAIRFAKCDFLLVYYIDLTRSLHRFCEGVGAATHVEYQIQ